MANLDPQARVEVLKIALEIAKGTEKSKGIYIDKPLIELVDLFYQQLAKRLLEDIPMPATPIRVQHPT